MLKGFRDFLARGNVVDLAVAVVIGAAAVYFLVVVPMQKLASMRAQDADADTPAPSDEAKLLTEIRDLLAAEQRQS